VKRIKNHVIICGYGRNGSQAALDLRLHDVPLLVIENNPDNLNEIRLYLFSALGQTEDFV